jgi:aminoglycoside phosphotransferase (APT) family kinase protein
VSRPTGIPEVRGLPREPFTAWAAEHLPGLGTGWRAELVSGGLSNLTYRVRGPERTVVVRRPPVGKLLPSAHDVGRERRVMAALRGTPVPVPEVLGGSEDPDVLGAPFFVMAEVKGVVYREPEQASSDLTEAERDALCTNLVDVLAAIHAVDLDATGMRDFGKPAGYLERQVRRWSAQWDASHTRELRAMDELVAQLDAQRPPEGEVTLVHGDYRHDNTLVSRREGHPVVAAVVDWELSTLGDPLTDAALMCVYRAPSFDLVLGVRAAWTSDRMPTPDELAQAYTTVSGRDLAHWGFYLGLANFKLGVIAEGITHRARHGSDAGSAAKRAAEATPEFMAAGLHALKGARI